MADNVIVDNGALTDYTVSTDDCAGAHAARVKLAYSADGSSTHVTADADGLLVNLGTNNDITVSSITAGDNNIGNVDIVTVPADPFGANADVASATGSISAKLRYIAATGIPVTEVTPGTTATALGKAEDAAHSSGDVGVLALGVRNSSHTSRTDADGDYTAIAVDAEGCQFMVGNVAHDSPDADGPIKVGHKAIAHGTNPTAVAAADRTDWYANRAGVPFVMGGHPNLQSAEYYTTAAATDDNIMPAISTGTKYVITCITVSASAANTVATSVRIGFGATTVPSQGASQADAVTKVILSHPGIAAGSGIVKGNGSGIVGIGGDGEELRITCSVPTTGSLIVQVDYYTIES